MNNIWLGFLFKHFLADYALQYPYMYLNKGKYGHLGGILHAGLHAVLTCLVLLLFGVYDAHILLLATLFDFVCHYHIDFTKSNVMKKFDLHTQNYWYWFVHGLDQLLHLLTYYVIIQFII